MATDRRNMVLMGEYGVAPRRNLQLRELGGQSVGARHFNAGEIVEPPCAIHVGADAIGFSVDLPRRAPKIFRAEAAPQRRNFIAVFGAVTAAERSDQHRPAILEARSEFLTRIPRRPRHRSTFLSMSKGRRMIARRGAVRKPNDASSAPAG